MHKGTALEQLQKSQVHYNVLSQFYLVFMICVDDTSPESAEDHETGKEDSV